MSRKNVLNPIFLSSTTASPDELTQSLAASFNTVSTEVSFQDNISYQINVTTSDSTGTFAVEASNDKVNWITILASGTVAAANDTIGININQFPFKHIRLAYTSTVAGTGTCQILLMARTVGM